MAPSSREPNRSRFFYGWYITGAGSLNNFLISAISVWGFGVFIQPLRNEFGWSSAIVAAGFSIRSFQQGFLAPFVGILIDRVGPRRMVFVGTLVLALGFFVFAATKNIPMYFVASLLIAFGQSTGSFTAFTAALTRWFNQKRGRALGLLNAGNGAGYFLVPLIALMVTRLGWRETLYIAGGVILLIGMPIAWLVKDHPAQLGLTADGGSLAPDASGHRARGLEVLTGASVKEALHTRAFYHIAVAQALGGLAVNAWVVHTIPHLQNRGFPLGTATLLGVGFAACQIAFRPLGGILGDRIGRRRLFTVGFFCIGSGMLVFSQLSPTRLWLLPLYYATFALGQAMWVVLQAATVADYFGARRFATINGLANLMQMPAGIAGPILAGVAFDRMGTYVPIFLVLACGPLLASVSMLLAPGPPRSLTMSAVAIPVVQTDSDEA